MKAKLSGSEDECYRAKQEAQSLREENSMLYAECHEKDKLINQLQTHVAVFEQEIKDKDQLFSRTKEVLEATRQQKVSFEENSEKKQVQVEKLETIVKSLSEELLKVSKLQEQLKGSMEKLEESKQLLKTNENVITWLNKQLNDNQMKRKQEITGTSGIMSASEINNYFKRGTVHPSMFEKNPLLIISGSNCPVTSAVPSLSQQFTVTGMKPHYIMSHEQGLGPKVQTNTQFLNSRTSSMTSKPKFPVGLCTAPSPDKENNFDLGSKYFKQRQDSIPLRGLSAHSIFNSGTQMAKPGHLPPASTYFCEQELEPS